MLLAEIHGKRFQPVEENEDFLTSAVFGHLRHIDQGCFWAALFRRAKTVDQKTSLLEYAVAVGVQVDGKCEVNFKFWPSVNKYGEPDLLMSLRCGSFRPMILVIEVKLFSEKSSLGPTDDQLCRYLNLLDDTTALSTLLDKEVEEAMTALIYLTERDAMAEASESIAHATQRNAATRMFSLQWQDMTEGIRELNPTLESTLGEVLQFLERRNFEHFRGYHEVQDSLLPDSGSYYMNTYFGQLPFIVGGIDALAGGFYAG